MISRRTLFGRMLVAASAFVVAPAVRVEAAPTQHDIEGSFPDGEPMDLMLRQARTEGYERGRAVEQAKTESRAMHAALDRMGLFDPITDDFGVRIAT